VKNFPSSRKLHESNITKLSTLLLCLDKGFSNLLIKRRRIRNEKRQKEQAMKRAVHERALIIYFKTAGGVVGLERGRIKGKEKTSVPF